MEHVQDILQQATQRCAGLALPYSGALLPQEAWSLMQNLPDAVLVDVRTAAELQFVGMVPNALCIEWRTYPGMQINPDFTGALVRQVVSGSTLMLMCRSGVRSDEAARAAMRAGFSTVYNVLEGFEGEKDDSGQRGHISGWKARGLPWVQS